MAFGMGGMETATPYPWGQYYHSSAAPEGGDEAVAQVVKEGIRVVAPFIEAGAKFLGVSPLQICHTFKPGDLKLGVEEREYVARIGGTPLSARSEAVAAVSGVPTVDSPDEGMGADTSATIQQAVKDAAIDEVKKQAIDTAVSATGASAPVVGAAVVAAEILSDPKAAFDSRDASINTMASVASAVSAATVPVVGWVIAAGMAVKAVFDYRNAKKEAEREKDRWDNLIKSIKSVSAIVQRDTVKLANDLIVRGVPIASDAAGKKKGSPPLTGTAAALMAHYRTQQINYNLKAAGWDGWQKRPELRVPFDQRRAAYVVKRDAWYKAEMDKFAANWDKAEAKKPPPKTPAIAAQRARRRPGAMAQHKRNLDLIRTRMIGTGPQTFEERLAEITRIGRTATLRILLQAARDITILSDVSRTRKTLIPPLTTGQVAAKVTQESPKQVAAATGAALQAMTPPEAIKFMADSEEARNAPAAGTVVAQSGKAQGESGGGAAVAALVAAGVAIKLLV